MRTLTWTLKDSKRYYWKVVAIETNEQPCNLDDSWRLWEYEIYRGISNGDTLVDEGFINVQEDDIPSIKDVMLTFQQYINCVSMSLYRDGVMSLYRQ